jgi:glucuronoarabinoxylan endo-1,4-beta-xylanase
LKATCTGGFTSLSNELTVTVNALPQATITPAGPTTFCSGGSVVLNGPVAANRAYQWKKGSNNIAGATLSSYTATAKGNYKLVVTNTATGCSKTSDGVEVTVNALPTATITPQGPTTFCEGGSVVLQANTGAGLSYKWKKGSNFISGATQSAYTATEQGNYKVEVTDANGCLKLSCFNECLCSLQVWREQRFRKTCDFHIPQSGYR